MSDTRCPHCGSRKNANPHIKDFDCGSIRGYIQTDLCREREAHNKTKRERNKAQDDATNYYAKIGELQNELLKANEYNDELYRKIKQLEINNLTK
jgi:hypothetical protein